MWSAFVDYTFRMQKMLNKSTKTVQRTEEEERRVWFTVRAVTCSQLAPPAQQPEAEAAPIAVHTVVAVFCGLELCLAAGLVKSLQPAVALVER